MTDQELFVAILKAMYENIKKPVKPILQELINNPQKISILNNGETPARWNLRFGEGSTPLHVVSLYQTNTLAYCGGFQVGDVRVGYQYSKTGVGTAAFILSIFRLMKSNIGMITTTHVNSKVMMNYFSQTVCSILKRHPLITITEYKTKNPNTSNLITHTIFDFNKLTYDYKAANYLKTSAMQSWYEKQLELILPKLQKNEQLVAESGNKIDSEKPAKNAGFRASKSGQINSTGGAF